MELYPVSEACKATNGSSSQLIASGKGKLLGIFVASTTSGTIKLWDNTSAATTIIVNTFTPNAAQFYPIPAAFDTGLFITIANTIDYTIFWSRP